MADQEVSPLSEEAVQVYKPESLNCKSKIRIQNLIKFMNILIEILKFNFYFILGQKKLKLTIYS